MFCSGNFFFDVPVFFSAACSAAPVPASSLVGSCVEAGFTDCCDPEQGPCYVLPTFCLCEPSCHLHNDCCDDINEICIPGAL